VPQPIMIVTLTDLGRTREQGDIARELGADLEAMNATLEPHERVAKCLVVDGVWSAENGLLTPTSKVRRSAVEAKYRSSIERAAATQRQQKIVWE